VKSDIPPPPAELAHLSAHLMPEQLLAFIRAFGGTRLYIPKTPAAGPLVEAVGWDGARALATWRGGEEVKVPIARHWQIRVLKHEGHSYSEIARRLRISEDTVWRNLSAARLTAHQPDLFEG
jgi:DNA-binding NarL/FixJ family response regulator